MSTPADRLFSTLIRVNGENADFYQCIDTLTVTEDLDRGASFTIRLVLCRNEDGSWPLVGEQRLEPWNRITIQAAFPDHADVIIDGYISHSRVNTNATTGEVSADIQGVDASYVMNLEHKTKVWTADDVDGEPLTYEKIVRKIIENYQLRPIPEDLGQGDAEGDIDRATVNQRNSDLRFIRRLARERGSEFYVRGADAHFHAPDLSSTPQKLIAANFGEETNCTELRFEVDGTRPTAAQVTRIDSESGETRTTESEGSDLEALGERDLSEMRGYGAPQTTVHVRQVGAVSEAQSQAHVQGLLRRHGWWIKAIGTLDGLRYGRILRSKKTVTIKGLGARYNGVYYVRKVVHTLRSRTYTMEFEATSNRLDQTGSEDFAGEQPDAVSVPLATGAGADPEIVTVREEGPQVAPE